MLNMFWMHISGSPSQTGAGSEIRNQEENQTQILQYERSCQRVGEVQPPDL